MADVFESASDSSIVRTWVSGPVLVSVSRTTGKKSEGSRERRV